MLEFFKWLAALLVSGGFFTFLQFLITRKDTKEEKEENEQKEDYKAINEKVEKGLEEREKMGRKRYEEHKEAIDGLNNRQEKIEEAIEELRKVVVKLAENDEQQKQILNANSRLLVGLTQDRLIHLTDKYCERGCITLDELAVIEEIYEPYHNEPLNGNGRGKAGVEECRKLPKVSEEIAIMYDKEKGHK